MTAGSPLVFPGSRVLAGWWKHLAPLQPNALWVSHLTLHRVEALVGLRRRFSLDSFPHFILKALTLSADATLESLEHRLGLGRPLLHQVLRSLEADKLTQARTGAAWSLTPLGHQAARDGTYPGAAQERLVFCFVETGQPDQPPHFLNLKSPLVLPPWPGVEKWPFSVDRLESCLRQSVDWKKRHGFDSEVYEILGTRSAPFLANPSQAWRHVLIDRVEHLVAMLVLAGDAMRWRPREEAQAPQRVESRERMLPDRLLGFAVQQDGWVLHAAAPAFVLDRDWQAPFPELAKFPAADGWREAWRTWCQPRGIPAAEVDACVLEPKGCRLTVKAPRLLAERLRAARSDVLKGEAWLLAGTGRVRMAVQVELIASQRDAPGEKTSART